MEKDSPVDSSLRAFTNKFIPKGVQPSSPRTLHLSELKLVDFLLAVGSRTVARWGRDGAQGGRHFRSLREASK